MGKLSIPIGKFVKTLSKIKGGSGSALPGLVVEKLDHNFLKNTLAKLPRGVVVISGTNGKTTTTKIVSDLLRAQGLKVFTNETGSNFVRGVISAILEHTNLSGDFDYDIAVLELDEAHAVKFCESAPVNYTLLLNVQRDQLDRFGEIDHTAELLQKVVIHTSDAVVLNREDPRIVKIKGKNRHYFGLSAKLRQRFPSDDDLLMSSAVSQPKLPGASVLLTELDGDQATYEIARKKHEVKLQLKGVYNAYNAAGALALCQQILPKVTPDQWLTALAKTSSAFGRGESFDVNGVPVEILLVKNPSAFQLSLESFVDGQHDYMIAINDLPADGRDVSWLWNVDFTMLNSVAMVSGIRATDMAVRLKYDEVQIGTVEDDLAAAITKFTSDGQQPKRIFATYTAMLEIRKIISGRSIL